MTEFNKTLAELWVENGEKPFEAESELSGAGLYRVFGVTQKGQFAVEALDGIAAGTLQGRERKNPIWRLHVPEPKLVPHWPAVRGRPGSYYTGDALYTSKEAAECASTGIVRLATEWPPIMLPEKK